MSWMSPPPLSLEAVRPACMLDVPLVLSPWGLACALQLARAARVWLAPTVWPIVDDARFYLMDERLVTRLTEHGGSDYPNLEARRDQLRRVAAQWRQARDELGLDVCAGLFWPAERLGEAVVPKGGDPRLIDRLYALAAGLDGRRRARGGEPDARPDAFADCARDTLALAAAFGADRPIVLTTRPADGTPPELSGCLEASGGPCRRLEDVAALRMLRAAVAPVLIASGLIELAAAGALRLAALGLVVPGAALLAPRPLADEDDPLRWNAVATGEEAALWEDAAAIWYDLP